MRPTRLVAAMSLSLPLLAACTSDSQDADHPPGSRAAYESGVSSFLDDELDLELTDDEDACVARALLRAFDPNDLALVGLDSADFQEYPLYYGELGRALDADRRAVIASEISSCLEPRCGSRTGGLSFGRELLTLLFVERDFHVADADLVDAMVDDASSLPPPCD